MKRLALALGGGNVDQFGVLAGAFTALEEIIGGPLHQNVARIAGTSAGSLGGSLAMTGQVEAFVELTRRLYGSDLVAPNRFGALSIGRNLLKRGAIYNPKGLRQLIDEYLTDEVLGAVPIYALAAVVAELQATPYLEEWIYPHQGLDVYRAAVLGSSSVPFVLPVVRAFVAGQEHAWVDGGVVATHPTRAALYPRSEEPIEALITISSFGPKQSPRPLKKGGIDGLLAQVKGTKRALAVAHYQSAYQAADELGVPQLWITADTDDYAFDATPELLAISRRDGYDAVMAQSKAIESLLQ